MPAKNPNPVVPSNLIPSTSPTWPKDPTRLQQLPLRPIGVPPTQAKQLKTPTPWNGPSVPPEYPRAQIKKYAKSKTRKAIKPNDRESSLQVSTPKEIRKVGRPPDYNPEIHPEALMELMHQGKLDCEV